MQKECSLGKAANWELRPMWDALLDMHSAIRAVCKKHDIRYWVCGGTALGAMRHKGFIPWDDDFDIMMLRPDYERFSNIVKELPPNLSWRSIDTDATYEYMFGKVYDNRIDFVEKLKVDTNLNLDQGLYIDVFPVDGQPSTLKGLHLYKFVRAWWSRLVYRLPISMQSRRKLFNRYVKLIKIADDGWCGVSFVDRDDQQRCYWPRSWFNGEVLMPFDRDFVPLVNQPEAFISKHYRNWKELPPEENRVPSHQAFSGGIVDF